MRIKAPRVKRRKRAGRLQSAKKFLAIYQGKNVLKGYCKHFGVDWRCAALELKQLGVKIDSDYLRQREQTDKNATARSRRRREQLQTDYQPSALDAWIAEDYPWHDALWQEQEVQLQDDEASGRSDLNPVPF